MIPHTDDALRMLSQRLMTQLLPDMKSTYSLSDGALIGLLMNAIADEMGEGIERRMQDIADMRSIVLEAGDLLPEEAREQAQLPPASYRLSDVNACHDALSRQIIALQTLAERQQLGELEQQIWRYLRHSAERHAITAIP